jgi:putative ABC transport system permease protein
MSLWKIAWRSIQQRRLASSLTAVSMGLGVALVVAVLVILGVIERSYQRNAQGYDLIVGPAKGSATDLVLSTVCHSQGSRPTGTLPYSVYRELKERFGNDIKVAVPICLGDNYKDATVIATLPDFFEKFEYRDGQPYVFAEGENFREDAPYSAVVGATTAHKYGLRKGDKFKPSHGRAGEGGHEHGEFTVVGVLAPTGTSNDEAVFVNLEGFYRQHAHHEEGEHGEEAADEHHHEDETMPEKEKEVTAILVLTEEGDPIRMGALPRVLEKELNVQAVKPSAVIADLLQGLVGDVQVVLLILAVWVVVVAGIGMMVSIYNSMNDRRHEIAIMRALGARRRTVMIVVVLESILLALGGGAIGVCLGHGLTAALGPLIAESARVSAINPFQFQTTELVLIPGLVVLASVVGYLPALMAYRTDVAESLISTP